MKKAKTTNKIFTILSAIVGVVFAFIIGVTYCATSLPLEFGFSDKSTAAYMGHQDFNIINDTLSKPVVFGEGAHNFEIAFQYAFDYDIDVAFRYSLSWSGGASVDTSNVILNFAQRDKIIYDENYIFLRDKVPAGNGKITLITGIDFVDLTDSTYVGQTLTITINKSDVRIYRSKASYASDTISTNQITKTATSSLAAQAWLQFKKNSITKPNNASAYVMMYNYRRNHEHGVPYPGANSAYKKPLNTAGANNGNVTASRWAGGNRAYAGAGMYVITGAEALTLEVMATGVWRNEEGSDVVDVVSENSIQFNYQADWVHVQYEQVSHLWSIRYYDIKIPAYSACYVDILDSIEIISAGRNDSVAFDDYRMVTRDIIINPTGNSVEFSYDETSTDNETNCKYIQYLPISNSGVQTQPTKTYQQSNIDVVNASAYNNGLYDAAAGYAMANGGQTFNTNISLINNTADAKIVKVDLKLYYHVSNAQTVLYDTTNNYRRASDLIDDKVIAQVKKAFDKTAGNESMCNYYYSYTADATSYLTSTKSFTVKISPYSSVTILDRYTVSSGLKDTMDDLFDDPTTTTALEYYDAWVYLVPTINEIETERATNLTLEANKSGNTVKVSVKNTSNNTITGVSISNFAFRSLNNATYSILSNDNAPVDWEASYWKYYKLNGGVYEPVNEAYKPTYEKNTYYLKSQTYVTPSYTLINDFTADENDSTSISNDDIVLAPGESVEILTANVTSQIMLSGFVTTSNLGTSQLPVLVNSGNADAFIINQTNNSYYIRFNGTYTGSDANILKAADNYNYYIGILRPNQVLSVPMSAVGTLVPILVNGDYASSQLTNWHSTAVTKMNTYFTVK